MPQQKLPGIVPTAQLRMDVLLGPRAEIVVIEITVRDAAGALTALRSFPGGRGKSATDLLDQAWNGLIDAMPPSTWLAEWDDDL